MFEILNGTDNKSCQQTALIFKSATRDTAHVQLPKRIKNTFALVCCSTSDLRSKTFTKNLVPNSFGWFENGNLYHCLTNRQQSNEIVVVH